MGLLMDIILIAILVLNVIIGYKKGLINVIFNICAFLLAIVITIILYKPVSNIIIENSDIREKFKLSLNQAGIHNPTFFAVPALEKAYTESDEWLTALKSVILDNIAYVKKFLKENLPGFNCANTEGTFTMWINYMDTGLKEEELKKILHEDAMVTVGLGTDFGVEGNGFIRINVALPRKKLEEAMNRILLSYNDWREQK